MAYLMDFSECAGDRIKKMYGRYPGFPRLQALHLGLWGLERALNGRKLVSGVKKYRSSQSGPLKIAFLNMGGFGDTVINLNWIYQFTSRIGCPYHFDIYSNIPHTFMDLLTEGWPGRRDIIDRDQKIDFKKYDIVFYIFSMIKLIGIDEDRAKASPFASDYCRRLSGFASRFPELFCQTNFLPIFQYAMLCGRHRWAEADFDGSLDLEHARFPVNIRISREELRQKFGLRKRFITVNREAGFKRDGKLIGDSTKLWSKEKYARLIGTLSQTFGSDHSIVLTGLHKDLDAGDAACIADLRGKTSLEDLIALARYADLHIGCEGMLPHLRHAVGGGTSLVLFGPSNSDFFNYPENKAFYGQECPFGCESITPAWSTACIKGYPCCRSIEQVSVDDVVAEAAKFLSGGDPCCGHRKA